MPLITLSDGKTLSFPAPVTARAVAEKISQHLAAGAVAAEVDGKLVDLDSLITVDARMRIITSAMPEGLSILRHSAAHVMAEAICSLFPGTRLAYGPAIEDGFFYDVDPPVQISAADLPRIEEKMREIAAADRPFIRQEMSRAEAEARYAGDPYKLDNIRRADGDVISIYRQGDFEDLCRGPHVPSTGRIGAFKVMSLAGAYWRGDASQPQLTRIYGTAFATAAELAEYLRRLEEAKKRDHRLLGRQMDIYSTCDEIGPGLILWHPAGSMLRHLIETFWKEEHLKRGYQLLYTPHIASEAIYRRSGHLENYREMMYAPMDIDGLPYRIKPMNCPGHIMIYNSAVRSYRDLPLRWAELGTVYRYEPSGTLHGMLRVRGFTQDDSHIFCMPEQIEEEVNGVLDLMEYMMKTFGYTYKAFLATRPQKSLGSDEQWQQATTALESVLKRRGMSYAVDAGGGVFYGPKIDIKLVDALGREWQGPTVQLDFNLPDRFKLEYVGADNHRHRVVMIHRTVLGSMERFIGGLLEHYGGDFPLWLAPEQVRILTVAINHGDYAEKIAAALRYAGLRAKVDARSDKIGAKVRDGELAKVPYLAIVGEREAAGNTVAVRRRRGGDLGSMKVDGFVQRLSEEVRARALPPQSENAKGER